MEKIYIFGHRNPDTDSVCSAISLSYLKNKLGYNTVVAPMNNYEWLYEITRDEYIDILQRAIKCM